MLEDNMKTLFSDVIGQLDTHIQEVSKSQNELEQQLNKLMATLDSVKVDESLTNETNANSKKIASLKSRLTVINTIVTNACDRCNRTLAACQSAVSSNN